jgi:hypothetical protein
MNLPFIVNQTLLDSIPSHPEGYCTKDGLWAAVPFGDQFMILHNGQQVHTAKDFESSKEYILKKTSKSKSSLEEFFV